MINLDNRGQVQLQTISNLITAGILKPEEAEPYNKKLSAMTWEEVAITLVESHELRENCPNPIPYCPIGEISRN